MKRTKLVRFLTASLAMLMLVTTMLAVASCGGGQEEETETKPSGSSSGGDDAYVAIPKEAFDRDLHIYTLESYQTDFLPDESEKGETLTDLLVDRNLRLKSDFGVTIKMTVEESYDNMNQTMTEQQSSRFDDFDLYITQKHNYRGMVLKNQCVDLNTVDSINLDGEWWDQAGRQALALDGEEFMVTGDASPSSMLVSACLIFNKNLMEDLKKTEPYETVEDGDWTLDRFYEYIDGVTSESTGNYGLTCWELDTAYSLFYGTGETFIKFDGTTPEVNYETRKVVDIYEKIYRVIVSAKSNYVLMDGANNPDNDLTAYKEFTNGNALFADLTLNKISTYIAGNMKDKYGILPTPKYSAEQADYQSFVNGSAAHFCISSTEKDVEFVGTMLEAIATYHYEYVTDKIYNVIVKSKDAHDPQSADMVDIILRNRVYDLAYWAGLSLSDVVGNGLKAGNSSINSSFNKAKNQTVGGLRDLLAEWENIKAHEKK